MSKSYRDLRVWQVSFDLAREVYVVTEKLPKHETYGLASQAQRSAVSIPSNIAEGQQRGGTKEFKQFLYIARGSAAELATQLRLITEIYKFECQTQLAKLEEVQKMLYALIKKL